MAVTIHAVKRLGALRPADAPSEEALREIPDRTQVRLGITQALPWSMAAGRATIGMRRKWRSFGDPARLMPVPRYAILT